MNSIEEGYSALQKLLPEIVKARESNYNEADTRFHIVNRLLIDVLGWPEHNIRNESPTESGYLDYSVGVPGAQFILEAKRTGVDFQLPESLGARVTPIPALISGSANRSLRDAIQQVARYAQERGVSIAVAFNGHQLVVFLASRTDGLAPLEASALVFATAEAMLAEFIVLWNNLSPEGLRQRSLYQTLHSSVPLPPDPLSFRLTDYPGFQRRNDLQTGLQILGDLFLGNLDDLEDLQEVFLRECYASSGALSQYSEVSKQILSTRYELLESVAATTVTEASSRRGIAEGFSTDVIQAALSNRPIILLGDVGSGKSTFIERLIHVDAKEVLGESVSIYVDFGSSSSLRELSSHVLDCCVDQLQAKYDTNVLSMSFAEDVLRRELKLFDDSPEGALIGFDEAGYRRARIAFISEKMADRTGYLLGVFEWIRRSWHRQVVIFLDNIDQRSAADQNEVFLIANELAQRWPATVFVTLRPETFYSSEREGAISGYHPRVFTISPPRTDVMLKLRVKFALDRLRQTGRLPSFPAGIQLDSSSLETFLEVLSENFASNENLMRLIDNLAGGNMRMALQFVTDFIGSGHINTEKIIAIQSERGYTIPPHEFLRSIMFGDHRYYDPDSSPVPNLLRLTRRDPREHFLMPLLLAHAQKAGELDTEHGYVSSQELYSAMQGIGFDPAEISDALDYGTRFRLVESTRKFGRSSDDEVYRITTVGAYAYKHLLQMFTYFDAIAVDLPVLDDEARTSIGEVFTLEQRVARVRLIAKYLDAQWREVPNGGPWEWPSSKRMLDRDIQRVERSMARNS
ncbi:hypothetical protein LLS1_07190 [Leifsonia sp. LS1]|uniref:hypothetical protein n=1 Tax=Leifsonia sp. LS1 TaxID=2828483 RepID=UPI001CFE4ED2|nr:hypothetical protein [Leifsonia sp. LS1]GIT79050.1 hypothetical protein LLS1_07190 [Leifsonia sp. LS1]